MTTVVKDSFGTHKWLGRMLLALAAARAVYSNKWILLDTNVSINSKMKLFETSITSIACFIAGHRNIRQRDVRILVVEIRSLDWCGRYGVYWSSPLSSPWHGMLHVWNGRGQLILECTHQKSRGQTEL